MSWRENLTDRGLTIAMLKEIAPYPFLCGVIIVIWYLIPIFQEIYPFAQLAIVALVLFFSGLALRDAGTRLVDLDIGELFHPILICSGLLLCAFAFFMGSPYLNLEILLSPIGMGNSPEATYALNNFLKYVLPFGLTVLSFTSLALYGTDSKSRVLSSGSEWLLNSRLKIAVGLCLLAIYFTIFRPLFLAGFQYLPIIDWGIIAYTAWRLFNSARPEVTKEESEEPFEGKTSYRRHEQEVEETYDDELTDLERAQEIFVEEGRKEDLAARLMKVIDESEIRNEKMSSLIAPLVNHRDKPVPGFALDWTKERAKRKNKKNRKAVVDQIMNEIEERKGAYP